MCLNEQNIHLFQTNYIVLSFAKVGVKLCKESIYAYRLKFMFAVLMNTIRSILIPIKEKTREGFLYFRVSKIAISVLEIYDKLK